MSDEKGNKDDQRMLERALDLAGSTVRFGFLLASEVLQVAADEASSDSNLPDPARPYSRKNLGYRINSGLAKLTGTMDDLCRVLD